MFLAGVIAAYLVGSDPRTAIALEYAKQGDSISGVPSAGFLVAEHDGESPRIVSLYRRLESSVDGQGRILWQARMMVVGSENKAVAVGAEVCPELTFQGEKLLNIDLPALLTQIDQRPPVVFLGADLYTVWSLSRQDNGAPISIQISASSGPVAAWASETDRVITGCLEAAQSN